MNRHIKTKVFFGVKNIMSKSNSNFILPVFGPNELSYPIMPKPLPPFKIEIAPAIKFDPLPKEKTKNPGKE